MTRLLAEKALLPVAEANARVQHLDAKAEALGNRRAELLLSTDDPVLAGPLLQQAERLRVQQSVAQRDLERAQHQFQLEKDKAAQVVGKDLVVKSLLKRQEEAAKAEAARKRLRAMHPGG